MRRILGNIAALALALGVSLATGEALLRAVVTLPLPRTHPEVRYLPHPVRRFTLAPSQTAFTYGAPVVIDARGFRVNGREPTSASGANGPIVLALGDSFTFGLGVRDEETWPAQLESQLRLRTGTPVSVVNAGTISYGVFQELDLLRSCGMALRPRVVVHALYWNDFMTAEAPRPEAPPVLTPGGYFTWDQLEERRPAVVRTMSWMVSNSALLFALRQAAAQIRQSGGGEYQLRYAKMLERGLSNEEWRPIETFYRDLLAMGQDEQFSVFVVIMPINDIVRRPNAPEHPYAKQARQRLESINIPYLDAFQVWTDELQGAQHFLPQGADAHLDAAGYRLIAEALASRLLLHAARRQP